MVDEVAGLEEVVLTKDGVRPLTATDAADTSAPASNGATPETAPAPTDTAAPPAVAPTETPAPAPAPVATPVLSQTPKAVEVIPAGTAPAAAPAAATPAPAETATATPAAAPVTPAPEAGPTEADRLKGLVDYGAAQAEEARRTAQGAGDRRAQALDRQLKTAEVTQKEQAKQIRELQTNGLSDEERDGLMEKFAQDDERAELNSYRQELVDFHRTVYIDSLSFEFSQFGVTRETLEQIETPEEMELVCERTKSTFVVDQAKKGVTPEAVAATETAPAAPAPAPAPAPAQATPAAVAQVPAGATAPSDVGTGSAPAETPTFNDGRSSGALQENLDNMGWDTVRLPRS